MGDFFYFMLQSSLLVALVLLIGKAGRKFLSARSIYFLWLIPAIRLLFPFWLIPLSLEPVWSGLHPYTLVQEIQQRAWEEETKTGNGIAQGSAQRAGEGPLAEETAGDRGENAENVGGGADESRIWIREGENEVRTADERSGQDLLTAAESAVEGGAVRGGTETASAPNWSIFLWLAGCMLTGTILFEKNVRFFRTVKKGAVKMELPEKLAAELAANQNMPQVYYRKGLASPCLAGVFRPVIYVNEKAVQNREVLKMALLHEQAHFRRKDHIWNFCRNLLCVAYWFHPLVWLGAIASARDAELACDESVVSRMGKEERKAYGFALLKLLDGNGMKAFLITTGMAGGKKEIGERIRAIAERRRMKKSVLAAALFLLILTGAVGCTKPETGTETEAGMGTETEIETKAASEEAGVQDPALLGGMENVREQETESENGAEEVLLEKKEALFSAATSVGPDGPQLDYVGEEVVIFHDYFGLVVYQYGEKEAESGIADTLDLRSIGCSATQGDSYTEVRVSADGTAVYLHAFDSEDFYRYDIPEKRLYRGNASMCPPEEELYQGIAEMLSDGQRAFSYQKELDIGSLMISRQVLGSVEDLPVWTEKTAAYMKELKTQYEGGETGRIVDEGWNGSFLYEPEPVEDLGGADERWRQVVCYVDEAGWKIENPYECPSWFETMDQSRRIGARRFDELLCSWEEKGLLFYRYDRVVYAVDDVKGEVVFSIPEGSGSVSLYAAGEALCAANNGEETLTFYDAGFEAVKEYRNVRLEEFSEGLYCVLDLDTGLYGYLDGAGEMAIAFQYCVAKGFHNGYAAVLTGAAQEVYL